MGGWLGRIASQYQIGVDELQQLTDLDLGIAPSLENWIALPVLPLATIEALACITRVSPEKLWIVNFNSTGISPAQAYRYCYKCLIANRRDYSAPFWQAHWLRIEDKICFMHNEKYRMARSSSFRLRPNFRRILNFVYGEDRVISQKAYRFGQSEKPVAIPLRPYQLVEIRTPFGSVDLSYGKN